MIDTTTETTGRRCKELRNLRKPLWDRLNLRRAWLSLRKLRLHLHSVMESQHWKKAARLRSSSKTKDSDDNTATETTGRRYKELRNLRTPLWDRLNSGTAWIREESCDCTSHSVIKSQYGKQETRLKELLPISQYEESYRSPVGTKENRSLTYCCPCRELVGVKVFVRPEWGSARKSFAEHDRSPNRSRSATWPV